MQRLFHQEWIEMEKSRRQPRLDLFGEESKEKEEELAEGKDVILDFAIDLLRDNPLPYPDEEEPDPNP